MLKRILSLEEEVEAFVVNNQEQIIAINRTSCRDYIHICYLEDVKKFIVMFIPLETLLTPEHQEIIATTEILLNI
jgi:hypothetical protein